MPVRLDSRRRSMNRGLAWLVLLLAWGLLLGLALALRPLLPVDETRYLTVAWEMWLSGDWLVPTLNGAPYSHKPPLLFWLIQAGWHLFGVNEWWPRLVPALVSLADLALTAWLARRLWPAQPQAGMLAVWVLFGSLLWAFFYTLVQFDLLLVLGVLVGLHGLLDAAMGRVRGWLLFAAGLGLGGLAKGPVVLVHLLPAALAAPWWGHDIRSGSWYPRLAAAVSGGVGLVLAWSGPAALAGGPEYARAIFWGQTADRLVDSVAHGQPVWWYLALLPLILLPWTLSFRPHCCARVRQAGRGRFLLAWFAPVVMILSLVSGKQMKYLLPLLPAVALFVAACLAYGPERQVGRRAWPAAVYLIGFGVLLWVAIGLGGSRLPAWAGQVHQGWALAPVLGGLAMLVLRPVTALGWVVAHGLATVVIVAVFHLGPVRTAAPVYDLRPLAARIAGWQAAGRPILFAAKYHGEFGFLGRLRRPLAVAGTPEAIRDWVIAHPDGLVIVRRKVWEGPALPEPLYQQAYRGREAELLVVEAAPLAQAGWHGRGARMGAPARRP